MGAAELLTALVALIPALVNAGQSVSELVALGLKVGRSGADPTPEDWDALHAIEASLAAAIDTAADPGG